MSKATFSLAERAIEKLATCVEYAPVDRLKLLRLHHQVCLRLEDSLAQSLRPLGVNQTEWLTLLFLYSTDTKTFSPSELAKSLSCSRTNATRLIEALKKRDYIHCTINSTDRRKMQISLNKTGEAFVETHLPSQFDNINTMIGNVFTEEEEKLFTQLNMKFMRYLEKKS